MRTTRGLAFDPGCDAVACAAFDSADPARACLDSCTNLFVPRLMPGEPAVVPESGVCNGMTLLECYAALDWDLGACGTGFHCLGLHGGGVGWPKYPVWRQASFP